MLISHAKPATPWSWYVKAVVCPLSLSAASLDLKNCYCSNATISSLCPSLPSKLCTVSAPCSMTAVLYSEDRHMTVTVSCKASQNLQCSLFLMMMKSAQKLLMISYLRAGFVRIPVTYNTCTPLQYTVLIHIHTLMHAFLYHTVNSVTCSLRVLNSVSFWQLNVGQFSLLEV